MTLALGWESPRNTGRSEQNKHEWQESLEYLESEDFDFQVNVVSSDKQFFRAVAHNPVVLDLHQRLSKSGELREEVLDRIYDLATSEIDLRYENPNDTQLAVLLWLTYYTAPEAVKVAAHYTSKAPQCWYVRNRRTASWRYLGITAATPTRQPSPRSFTSAALPRMPA